MNPTLHLPRSAWVSLKHESRCGDAPSLLTLADPCTTIVVTALVDSSTLSL